MIRDVVIHLFNDQPVVADLLDMPAASDAGLVCTNLRTLDGRRPVFIDHGDSTFFFPYQQIRFVEIPRTEDGARDSDGGSEQPGEASPEPAEEDLEIDEDFLRRIREA